MAAARSNAKPASLPERNSIRALRKVEGVVAHLASASERHLLLDSGTSVSFQVGLLEDI